MFISTMLNPYLTEHSFRLCTVRNKIQGPLKEIWGEVVVVLYENSTETTIVVTCHTVVL